jgi:hypothetical protein
MNKYSCVKLFCFFTIIIIIACIPLQVYADMGPKPRITIKVTNPPEGEYYLDLLVKDEPRYNNLRDNSAGYDEDKLKLLQDYNKDGWHAGLAKGTHVPMHGDLTGEKVNNDEVHVFSYVGVPDDFKIILITPDNKIRISKEIHKTTFSFTVAYDYTTGNINLESITFSYLKQFFITFSSTILIEGLLLILFGFSIKKNWKVFIAVNIITQLFLTVLLGRIIIKDGLLESLIAFIPLEIIIFAFETVAYTWLIKEHKKGRRIAYALTANFFSFIAGILQIILEYKK